MFLKTALLVLKKDFAIEVKSFEIFSTTLFFAVSCVLIFSFGFVEEGTKRKAILVDGTYHDEIIMARLKS